MDKLLEHTLTHLRALVGFDTRNPPREIGTGGIFDYLRAQLPGLFRDGAYTPLALSGAATDHAEIGRAHV